MFCMPHTYIHGPVLRVVGKEKSTDRDKKRNIKEKERKLLSYDQSILL